MTLSLEQKEELSRLIKNKEKELKRLKFPVKSGDIWCKAIISILNGGSFQSVMKSVEAYPQECLFMA